ncbi:MAG: ABC transporter ATP-binding protein [Alphaproteobacteria bacterium]|nr:ABC transporter ATP-binding protein [Alphaproteobacteria bacterium]
MSLLTLTQVHVAYKERNVLKDISFSLKSGEVLGVIGANGAGKSSLLRTIAGITPHNSGKILWENAALIHNRVTAQKIAYQEQNSQCHWPLEVEKLVTLGRLPHGKFAKQLQPHDHIAVMQAMEDADIMHLRHRTATKLSAGEQARVFLARALAVQPQLLLVDEPVSGLDPAHQLAVMALLRRKASDGMGVIVVLHDLALAARYCDRLLLINHQTILAQGNPAQVLSAENLRTAMQVKVVNGEHEGVPYILPWQAI